MILYNYQLKHSPWVYHHFLVIWNQSILQTKQQIQTMLSGSAWVSKNSPNISVLFPTWVIQNSRPWVMSSVILSQIQANFMDRKYLRSAMVYTTNTWNKTTLTRTRRDEIELIWDLQRRQLFLENRPVNHHWGITHPRNQMFSLINRQSFMIISE